MFVVFTMVLNEAKFLGYAVRSWLSSDLVQAAVVVEGCVDGMREYADPSGLSLDGTGDILKELKGEFGERLFVKHVGFVRGKRELQNAALDVIHKNVHPKPKWVIIAGADELYRSQELSVLAQVANKSRANVLLYPFWHFWRRPDVVAVGSSWRVWMHRCYRYFPNLRFKTHNSCPLPSGRHERVNEGVFVYHYVGMQDWETTRAKLALYTRRDGHRLKVRDTWSNWRWREETQWTHKGGSAKRFVGEHPDVIAPQVWELMPRLNGHLMVAPWVPWEAEIMKSAMVCVGKDFLTHEGYRRIANIIARTIKDWHLVSFDRDVIGTKFRKRKVAPFKPEVFGRVYLNLCLGYPFLAGSRPRNLLVTDGSFDGQTALGYVVLSDDSVDSFGDLAKAAKNEVARYEPVIPKGVVPESPKELLVREKPLVVQGTVGGLAGQKQEFVLRNTSDRNITQRDAIVCSWLDAFGKPIKGAARTSQSAPIVLKGQSKKVKVQVPRPPLTVGTLLLDVSVMSGKLPLGLGIKIKMRFRG